MNHCVALAVSGLLIWTGVGHAQETYTVKLRERRQGDTVAIKKSEVTSTKVTVTDGGGNVVLDNRDIAKNSEDYVETIFQRQAGKPATKLERQYTKALRTKNDQAQDDVLHGKTVLIEKIDGKYTFTYKGGRAVEGDAAAALAKEYSKKAEKDAELERLILPSNAVAVGGTWKIDMKRIVEELAKQGPMAMNAAKATGQGKLLKAYKKDGRQFGEMKFTMDIPLTSVGEGKQLL